MLWSFSIINFLNGLSHDQKQINFYQNWSYNVNPFPMPLKKSWGLKMMVLNPGNQNLKSISKSYGLLQSKFRDFLNVSLFHTFWHFEQCLSDHLKKCVMKFQKSKIWDVHFLCFSVPVVMVYVFFFSIQMCLVVNWGRKWSVFDFWNISKISQNVCKNQGLKKMIS